MIVVVVGLLQVAGVAGAQPATDIYLGDLIESDGRLGVEALHNVTGRPGYDNQPSFTPDGAVLLYTSVRAGGQADTYSYDIATGRTIRLTRTPESEYSPAVMPGGAALSVVRVEADSTQRLWRFDLDGNPEVPLLPDVKPVGYFAWYDSLTLALFVLGDPPTLQIADLRTGRPRLAADRIGRSIHKVPSRAAISFVRKRSEDDWWIEALDLESGAVEPLVRTLPGSEDYAWTPDGTILMGHDSRLYRWRPGSGNGWEEVADLGAMGISGITRIAVSPAADRVAIVAADTAARGR